MQTVVLCILIFIAGFIDSIAGGGGLISVASYMACGLNGAYALGTNKFSSVLGSSVASFNYFKSGNYHAKSLIPSFVMALLGSTLGSRLAVLIPSYVFQIILLCATPFLLALVLINKNFDRFVREGLSDATYVLVGALIGLVVGFYDGLYGPGTGIIMQIGFIVILGLTAKKAGGNARIVNWASNVAAVITFISAGTVVYSIAIPCAFCSVAGNYLGSRLAIKKDVKVIRPVMVVVVILLFIKVLLDYIGFSF
ncbi:MAG: TSUP family transporter [Sphaerochaetaceae bacterium]|nr:TSUP family transporter [Sphaerochaetaceae bacterium]